MTTPVPCNVFRNFLKQHIEIVMKRVEQKKKVRDRADVLKKHAEQRKANRQWLTDLLNELDKLCSPTAADIQSTDLDQRSCPLSNIDERWTPLERTQDRKRGSMPLQALRILYRNRQCRAEAVADSLSCVWKNEAIYLVRVRFVISASSCPTSDYLLVLLLFLLLMRQKR